MISVCAIIPPVPTLNVRDVPDEIAAAIEAAANEAGARSREAYLRDFLKKSFGPDESTVAGMSTRARTAVGHFEDLGRFRILEPAPTIPKIARALGHSDAGLLESELRGDRALSFSDGDRLCHLFSLDPQWLESGDSGEQRFLTRAQFHDCRLLLHSFLETGIPYEELYFILSDRDQSEAAIIGHTPNDDPSIGWRYEVLVDGIPVHNSVGAGGRRQRRDLADLVVALYDDRIFPEPVSCAGRLVPYAQYIAMRSGYVHPATLTNTYAHAGARPMSTYSDWHEDLCDFQSSERYTRSYNEGRAALLSDLEVDGITSIEAYRKRLRERLASWKTRRSAAKEPV